MSSSSSSARTPEQRGFGQRERVARSLHLAAPATERHASYPLRPRTVKPVEQRGKAA
jgi:hypothetical protein